jgi:hypothetical protein
MIGAFGSMILNVTFTGCTENVTTRMNLERELTRVWSDISAGNLLADLLLIPSAVDD